jgi:hypothetical protein
VQCNVQCDAHTQTRRAHSRRPLALAKDKPDPRSNFECVFLCPSSSPLTAHSGGAAAGAAAVAAAAAVAGRAGSCSAEQASVERDSTLIIIIIIIIIDIIIIDIIIIIIVECDGHGAQGRRRHLAGHSAAADQRRLHARGLQRMLFLVRPLRFAF